MLRLIVFIVVFYITTGYCQEIKYYNLDVNINVKNKTVTAKGTINIDFKQNDSIAAVFRKKSRILQLSCNGKNIRYSFDTLKNSPMMYVPMGAPLIIYKEPGAPGDQVLNIEYVSDMTNMEGWASSFSDKWIELNLYSGWFPLSFSGSGFTSEFSIQIDPGYSVTGSGIINKNGNNWVMKQPWKGFDNVIIAARNLKSKSLRQPGLFIETTYDEFPDYGADSINNECKHIIALFENYFGKLDSSYLKFVVAPFEKGGGYSRKNFICMRTKSYNFYTQTKGLAHEIAHFWWHNAGTTTWEDWLNEAFAEYSMFMYIRERHGVDAFNKLAEEYTTRCKELPGLWGIDRNSDKAYPVLYEKGALVLYEMEKRVGEKEFINIMKKIIAGKINTTADLLKLLQNEKGNINSWLENKLKES